MELLFYKQRSLHNTEEECSHLKDMCEKSQEELQHLAEKYQDQLKEVANIQGQLNVSTFRGQVTFYYFILVKISQPKFINY